MALTDRERDLQTAMQQAAPLRVREFAADLPQPLAVPPVVGAPLVATLDLSGLSREELDALRAQAQEITGATTAAVTLPSLADVPVDWCHTFLALDGTLNNVTLTPAAGETIMGAGTAVLAADLAWITLYKRADGDSVDWFALGAG